MAQPWLIRPPATPSPELVAAVGGHPLVAQILAQRGIDTPARAIPFLDPNEYRPAPPGALIGVEEAAQILHDAIALGRHILVWGDFDVDGQTSTSLLVTALQTLAGDEHVRFHVPNRFAEGHGIKVDRLVAALAASDIPIDVLLTCDTGISEAPAVAHAKDQGLTVVITDHHDLSAEFQGLRPGLDRLWGVDDGRQSVRRADAIVNPKFLRAGDPLRTLPGVGVAFKLVQRLYALAGRSGEEDDLLDLVALGIVADVAEQVHDARYLLQRGLQRLRTTRRAGLLALMNIARIEPASLTADSIGFQLGPRMNALGRLEDATVAVELLTTRDAIRAGQLAGKLERLNQERRLLTRQTTHAALDLLERDPGLLEQNALVLSNPNWHAGVVGIVASKLVEEFGKPTVLLLNPPGEPARGSARSVPGVDIGAAIAACSHLLITHGGHPGAAGVSLLPENIGAFRRALSQQVMIHRDATVEVGLPIDVESTLEQLNLALFTELARLAPFGQGNPTPQFVSYNLAVLDDRRIGREGTHRKLTVRPAGMAQGAGLPVLWFGGADAELPAGPIDLVYTLNVNEFRGEHTLQLLYVDSRLAEAVRVAEVAPTARQRVVHDLRRESIDVARLYGLDGAAWYAEGVRLESDCPGVVYAPRMEILRGSGGRLVLWSIPPTAALLRWLLETVDPAEIYLCAQPTTDDSWQSVLHNVGAMCKYALGRDGQIDLGRMAARLGAPEAIVRHGLLWMESRGVIRVDAWRKGACAVIAAGDNRPVDGRAAELQGELETQLAEVRAYRRFFQRARPTELGIEQSST